MTLGLGHGLAFVSARRVPLVILLCCTSLLFLIYRTHSLDTRDESLAELGSEPESHSQPSSSGILLVSSLFALSKSKHSMHDYESWLKRFLGSVTTEIYFFTTPELEGLVRKLRGELPITINTTFGSAFEVPPLKGLEGAYKEMHGKDRERRIHSPGLYAVWNAKPYFLDEGMRNSGGHEYGFWVDAGSFRDAHVYSAWPDRGRVNELLGGNDEVILFPIYDKPHPSFEGWTEDMGPVDNEFSEGSFFGGTPHAIRWWRETFYTYHDHYLKRGLFVGKDQTLINSLFLLFPSRFITVWLRDPEAPAHQGLSNTFLGSCGVEWYYYQFWLADTNSRSRMRDLWLRAWHWDWWKDRQGCRLTRVLRMSDVLSRAFGVNWSPPPATIGKRR